MTVLSLPISGKLEKVLDHLMHRGYAENKIEVIHRAILQAEENEAISVVLESEQAMREGKILRGNPRELIKQFQ